MSKEYIPETDEVLEAALRKKLEETPLAEVGLQQRELDLLEAAGFYTAYDLTELCTPETAWKIRQIGEGRMDTIVRTFRNFSSAIRHAIQMRLVNGDTSLSSNIESIREFGTLVLPDEDAKNEMREIQASWTPVMRRNRAKGKFATTSETSSFTIPEVKVSDWLASFSTDDE